MASRAAGELANASPYTEPGAMRKAVRTAKGIAKAAPSFAESYNNAITQGTTLPAPGTVQQTYTSDELQKISDAMPAAERQRVMAEYQAAVDPEILQYMQDVKTQGAKGLAPLNLGATSEAHNTVINELTGIDTNGYQILINGNGIQHI